ncbi:amidophosphoribosyltransferase [Corynebacterium hadale]|uniref:amidophosphoribosyltransferase n=1 Tax=Corynebacterium hadale TaxID=2026255 RepID=UPI000BAA7E38|nr:amidophosphoribosyltransferase [Corynebacterium hadale]PAT12642.1 amidophosphoribosyltransferase [Corynebacterium hadale]
MENDGDSRAQLDDAPRDECGVFGVWAPGEDVSKLSYFGLFALQHRGQEGAGIAVGDHSNIVVFKDTGLVSQVFDESVLDALQGDVAIGHTRYSTAGGNSWDNVQPMFRTSPNGTDVALAHNGNLTNYQELQAEAIERKLIPADGVQGQGSSSDTAVVSALLADRIRGEHTLIDAALDLLPRLQGAFCFMVTDGDTLFAARDPHGVRPLSLGRLERGWVVASETCALDIVGASFVRDIEPGELVAIDATGIRSERFAEAPRKARCVFEYVYVARPDSVLDGQTVNASRVEIGRRLARVAPVEADLVMPVPESGTPAAIGYAEESGIPFKQGLMKNAYVGRTFIQPSDTLRQLGLRLKLNPVRAAIEGKRLVVVDDSIVRGNTQRKLIRMLHEAGAAEVHVRIASPPVKWPCFYGIDFASPGELIANHGRGGTDAEVAESIRTMIGADSLAFVPIDDMIAATNHPAENLCAACFDGNYPLGLPDGNPNADLVRRIQKGDTRHD